MSNSIYTSVLITGILMEKKKVNLNHINTAYVSYKYDLKATADSSSTSSPVYFHI